MVGMLLGLTHEPDVAGVVAVHAMRHFVHPGSGVSGMRRKGY